MKMIGNSVLTLVLFIFIGCHQSPDNSVQNSMLNTEAKSFKHEYGYNNNISIVNNTPYGLAVYVNGRPLSVSLTLNGPDAGEIKDTVAKPEKVIGFNLGWPSEKYRNNTNDIEQVTVFVKAYSKTEPFQLIGVAEKKFYNWPRNDEQLRTEEWVVKMSDIKPANSKSQ